MLLHGFEDAACEVGVLQVQFREVRGNALRFQSHVQPLAYIGACGLEHIEVEFADGAFAFQDRNEVHGRHNRLVANPADECFGTAELLGEQVDLGLEEDDEFLVADGVVEFARNFLLVQVADEHFLGEEHDVACLDGARRVHGGTRAGHGIADVGNFVDGVDAHAALDAHVLRLGTLAEHQFAGAELRNETVLVLLFHEHEEVVAAESCDKFVFVDVLQNLADEHSKRHVAHLVAQGLVHVLKILQVDEYRRVVLERIANVLLVEHEDARLVVGAGHRVGDGRLAGVAHEPCASGQYKEVPA